LKNQSQKVKKDERDVEAAARQVAKAVHIFRITLVRKSLKNVSHRTPKNERVKLGIKCLFNATDFTEFVCNEMLCCMRDIESRLGKPSKSWSIEERLEALADVEWYLYKLVDLCDPPRGRPRLKQNIDWNRRKYGGGLLNNAVRMDKAELRKIIKNEKRKLENRFLAYIEGTFAGKEAEQYSKVGYKKEVAISEFGTLGAWRQYKEKKGIDTSQERVPSGTFQGGFKEFGIDPKDQLALKKQISRRRRLS